MQVYPLFWANWTVVLSLHPLEGVKAKFTQDTRYKGLPCLLMYLAINC